MKGVMIMKRIRTAALAIAALALIAGACGGDAPGVAGNDSQPAVTTATTAPATAGESAPAAVPTGSISVAYGIGVITFNPHISQPGPQYGHLEAVYDTYIRIGADGTLEPGLATDWGFVGNSGLQFKMTLRSGVAFHDGEIFNADVAKANLDAARSQNGARTALLGPIESVDVIDNETIVINLSRKYPTLPRDLGSMLGMVVSPNLLGTDDIEANAIGTGPYRYDQGSSVPGDRYEFVAFDGYWDEAAGGRPATITLITMTDGAARLSALRSGQLSLAVLPAPLAETAEVAGLQVQIDPARFWGLLLQDREGERVPELGILEVRQAMNHAVDRQAIVDAVVFGLGTPTNQLWNPTDSHFNSDVADLYPYDPDRARQLLESVGVSGFSFTAPFLPVASSYAQAVQEYLRVIGIEMEIVILEPGTLGREARSGDWAVSSMIAGGVESAVVDTGLFIAPDAIYNTFGTATPELTEMINAASGELDPAARSKAYQAVSRYVTEQAWFLVTHFASSIGAYDSSISNWQFRSDGEGVPVYRELRVAG